MSKYTTEVRFICETLAGYDKSKGYDNIEDIISKTRGKIFSFKYPIFDENYRSVLETKILKRYYTREIGFETYGLWKHFLDMRMNEIMPYYNQLYESTLLEFNPFYDTDYTTNSDRKIGHDEKRTDNATRTDNLNEQERYSDTRTDNLAHHDSTASSNKSKDRYSDTPQGSIDNLENNTYLTDARIVDDNGNVTNDGTNTGTQSNEGNRNVSNTGTQTNDSNKTRNFNSTDDYLEHVAGKRGTQSYSKLLDDYRKTFLNIDVDVINDLNDLFMGLW